MRWLAFFACGAAVVLCASERPTLLEEVTLENIHAECWFEPAPLPAPPEHEPPLPRRRLALHRLARRHLTAGGADDDDDGATARGAGTPACSAPLCFALMLSALPQAWAARPGDGDLFGAVRCTAFDAERTVGHKHAARKAKRASAANASTAAADDGALCACAAPPVDTLAALRAAADGASWVLWGDSTTRNFVTHFVDATMDLAALGAVVVEPAVAAEAEAFFAEVEMAYHVRISSPNHSE